MATFGETGIGTSTDNWPGGSFILAFPATPASSGTLTKISFYTHSISGTTHAKAKLYADSGGVPGARLAESTEAVITALAWYDFPISCPIVGGTPYWLVIHPDIGGVVQYYFPSALNSMHYSLGVYPNNPDPMPALSVDGGEGDTSIYGTYTLAGRNPAGTITVHAKLVGII